MILQALYQLANTERLMEDPDYEWKPVAWLAHVSQEGKFLSIEGTHHIPPEEQLKRKPKGVAKYFKLPREKAVTCGDRAFLLFGKSEYVFGEDPQTDPEKRRSRDRLAARFSMFRNRVKECLDATGDEGVAAVWKALENLAAGRQNIDLPEGYASNDLFAFVYAPDVDMLVTDREKVRAYWEYSRREGPSEGEPSRRCLVSGKLLGDQVLNFPLLKRVPGGTTSGVALVSFNQNAFKSYGWDGNLNAAISRDAAEASSTALNRLLHPAYPAPDGRTLPQRNLRLSDNTIVCFWSPERNGDSFCSAFSGLMEGNPEKVAELYRSVWRGRPPDIQDPSAFYALTLTGSQGRAIVRDWFESTVSVVVDNLAAHFADLDIVRNTPKPRDRDLPPQIPLPVLLEAVAEPGENRRQNVPAPLAAYFVDAALSGAMYPLAMMQRALLRFRAELGMEQDEAQGWSVKQWNDARAAVIKAALNRRQRFYPDTTCYEEVQRDMDPSNSSSGYTLGRLMAVLERMQQEAMENVNASVVDRYFSAASAAPKSVFVRLMKNARHHVRKAQDDPDRGGTVFRLDRLVDELADRFDPEQNGFPSHLDLEQQGLFVLGYHQMRRWLWMPGEERERWEKAHPSAPRAYLWKTSKSLGPDQ